MTHSMEDMVLPPPTDEDVDTRLEKINQLKYFLATAPTHWDNHPNDPPLQRYSLPTGESVSCVRWHQGFFISGTDIVRSLVYRFHAFGRPVQNLKKFEEGVFSDLRNLKPGTDATLEEPKSSFLDLLYKHNCIRTQKKQKVFNWFSVPHDRLFLDALERDLKRNKLGTEATSEAVAHPALSITLDTTQALFDEFRKNLLSDLDLNACLNGDPRGMQKSTLLTGRQPSSLPIMKENPPLVRSTNTIFGHFSLFEGSPTYKQRRRRTPHSSRSDHHHLSPPQQHRTLSPFTQSSFRPSYWPYNNEHSMNTLVSSKSSSEFVDDPARLYTCPLSSCGKIFKRLEHLKRHLRTHTMERPYLCALCGKRFSRSDNLAQHKKTHKRRQRNLNENHSDNNDHSNNHSPLLHQSSDTSTLQNGKQQQQQQHQNGQMQQSHYERNINNVSHHQQNSYYGNTGMNSSTSPSSSSSSSSSSLYYHNQHQASINWVSSATIPPITVTNNIQGDHLHDFFPAMSASTSSSSISSCQSSPATIPPIPSQLLIKAEEYPLDHRPQQVTPPTPTTTSNNSMDDLLSETHQPHSNQHHQQQEQQQGHRDWQFNMDWEQGSCLSSPQSSSLFIHPSASSSSSSSTSTPGYGPSSSQPQYPPASSFHSTQFRINYEQQQQQQQQHPPQLPSTDQESPSLKPIGTNATSFYYPTSGFQEMAFRPMDSLMHF